MLRAGTAKGGQKRSREVVSATTAMEQVVAEKTAASSVYKSLFISAADKKRIEQRINENFCARGMPPEVNRGKIPGVE